MNQLLLIFAAGLLAQPILAQAQADYDYQTIDYPGTDFTQVFGINTQGDVVGTASNEENCFPGTVRYGWLRTVDGNMSYFIVNGWRTSARGITNSGKIVGFALDGDNNEWWGFVTEIDNTPCQSITIPSTDLLTFPEAHDEFIAQGVNNQGKVVGWYEAVDYTVHGFIATPE